MGFQDAPQPSYEKPPLCAVQYVADFKELVGDLVFQHGFVQYAQDILE